MKRMMKKIGICLFTIAILLGTMPLTSVKATGQSTITVDEAGELIKKALDGKVSNDITEQEIYVQRKLLGEKPLQMVDGNMSLKK